VAADTRQRILDAARRLFNERGVHATGVREIARALGMSPGNLAYHFPTKDLLVEAVLRELRAINQQVIYADFPTGFSLHSLYAAAIGSMRNLLEYRFVLLGYTEAVAASPALRRLHAEHAAQRERRTGAMIAELVGEGWLAPAVVPRVAVLHEQGEMISSYWLHAAALRDDLRGDRAIVLHYAKLGCALLEPWATTRGKRQLAEIAAGKPDARIWPISDGSR
jgi:AcrR family transcriptional regulator